MSRRQSAEAFDRMFRYINDCKLLFGRKIVVFGRDFCQILSIMRRGTMEQQIDVNLVSSYVWSNLIEIKLTKNM